MSHQKVLNITSLTGISYGAGLCLSGKLFSLTSGAVMHCGMITNTDRTTACTEGAGSWEEGGDAC